MNKWVISLVGAGTVITAGAAGLAAVACGSGGTSNDAFTTENLTTNMYLTVNSSLYDILGSGDKKGRVTSIKPGIANAIIRSTTPSDVVAHWAFLAPFYESSSGVPDWSSWASKVLKFQAFTAKRKQHSQIIDGSDIMKIVGNPKSIKDTCVGSETWVSYDLTLNFSEKVPSSFHSQAYDSAFDWFKAHGLPSGSFTISKGFNQTA